ncbi:MAG TPA: T9SS type A sorting domain-containing protein [Flavobacteriales bacterium]
MKQILALLIGGTLQLGASAQTVLTAATNSPALGTGYTLHYGAYVAPGIPGIGQTWNLAGLSADSSLAVEFVEPANTPQGAQFPTATIAEVNDVVTQYYRVTANGIHFAGSDDGESLIVHAPQGTYLPFPCTFGTTWSTPQNATFTVEGSTVTRTGTFSGHVDGSGTLVLPGATIPNVLRVHWTHVLQDVMGPITIAHVYDSYAFFTAGHGHPIAEVVTASIDFGGGPQVRQFSRWTADVSTGIDVPEAVGVSVFPNPASEEVSITWSADFGRRAAVSVMDMAGRAVMLGRYTAVQGTTTRVDIQRLFPGMYQLVLVGENGQRAWASLCVR